MANMNRSLQARKIREDLVRAGHDPETVDVHALIDPTLSLSENRRNIAQQLRYKVGQRPSARQERKRADVGHCESLRDQCEIRNDKQSCRDYGKLKCASVTGRIPGCRVCSTGGAEPKPTKARMHNGSCMVTVAGHWRRCRAATAARMGR